MRTAYLPTLTPLRGVAAVLVVLFHSQIFIYPVMAPAVSGLVENGWLWVDFFFVLSGFILTHVYGEAFQGGVKRRSYGRYLRARFARVYPLHFFTLLWALAAGTLILTRPVAHPEWNRFFHFIFDVRTVPACVFLVQALHLFPTAPMNTVSWSLSTEWWMYLLFPLLMPLVAGGRVGRAVGLLGVAAGYGLVKYWLVPAYGMHLWRHQTATLNTINDFAFVRCMMGFVLGMITCRWFQLGAGRRWLGRDAGFVIVVAALLLSLHFDLNELVPVALFPFLILATAYNESAAGRLLASRPAQRLGDWSFSIYMVHMPLFFTYRGLAPLLGLPVPQGLFTAKPVYAVGWIGFALFLAATLATAALCYRWLEVPARNYLNGRRAARKEPVSGSFV